MIRSLMRQGLESRREFEQRIEARAQRLTQQPFGKSHPRDGLAATRSEFAGSRKQLISGHDARDQIPFERLCRIDDVTGEQEFGCTRRSDAARQ
jgi:hypothetical protein